MAHEDWDLFAIVRSCKATTFTTATTTTTAQTPPTTTTNTATTTSTFIANQENGPFSFPNLVQQPRTNGFQELHPLFMSFNPTTTSTSTSGNNSINPNSPFSDFSGSIGQHKSQQQHHTVLAPTTYTSTSTFDRLHHQHQQQQSQQQLVKQPQQPEQQQQHNQLHVQAPQTTSMGLPNTQSQTPRSRKRKSQQKKIVCHCHVTADNLSSDLWAWRKYGQKPIKGSPYQRNYYRCSSCKGCAARKQVERSTTEPNMFILTYTGEHKHPKPSHRNSLAGSTRNKPSTTRLPEIQENGSPCIMGNVSSIEIDAVSSTQPNNTSLLMNVDTVEDPVSAGDDPEPEPKPGMGSDEDAVLIPNSMGLPDAVFLGLNGVPGLAPVCSEPSSNSNRPNPG